MAVTLAASGPDALAMLESYIVTLLLATWLCASLYRRWRPSGIALVLYFAVVILPMATLHGMAAPASGYFFAVSAGFGVLLATTDLLPRVAIPRPSPPVRVAGTFLLVLASFYTYGALVLGGGLQRFNLDLLAVYQVRAGFRLGAWPLMGYLVPWQASVFNTALLSLGLYRKKYWAVAFVLLAELLLFGMTGQKSILLAPLLVVGVFVVWRRRAALPYLFWGGTAMVVAAYLIFVIAGDELAPSILVRRLFFVPASNHYLFYDFFSNTDHPFVMLSNSILAPFIDYPYDQPLMQVISFAYWGRDFSPNVGYLGDAFAQFGFLGMFVFSGLLGVFLRLVDSAAAKVSSHVAAAMAAVPAMALTNSALLTSLLTHGFIPCLLAIWLLQGKGQRKVKEGEVEGRIDPLPMRRRQMGHEGAEQG